MADLTWNEFRAMHPGIPQNEISDLWSQYKDGDYTPPESAVDSSESRASGLADDSQGLSGGEPGTNSPSPNPDEEPEDEDEEGPDVSEDTPDSETEESDDDAGDVVTGKDDDEELELEPTVARKELMQQFVDTYNKAFGDKPYNKQEKAVILRELYVLADKTIGVPDYSCNPTHGWQLWIGPEQACLLVNETTGIAFCVNRAWWHHHYLGAALCAERVCDEQSQVDSIRDGFGKRDKLVRRVPVPGHEIMLPHSRLEIWNTASGSWD